MKNRSKLFFESLGCPKNRVDSEVIIASFLDKGWEKTDDNTIADCIIVNSCGFIKEAREETISRFFELNSNKKKGAIIALTGCLVQLYPEINNMLPEADIITGIDSIPDLAEAVTKNFNKNYKPEIAPSQYIYNSNSPRVLTLSPFTAYVKIADGCDNFCSYCSIPFIRGKYRERYVEDIVREAENLVSNGVKEIVLISQDTTKFGKNTKSSLIELLKELNLINGDFKIRAMYLYPSGITKELVKTICKLKKVVPYFEVPFQHTSDEVLKEMNRTYSKNKIKKIIDMIKKECGGNYALRTTFISSFPKEKEKDHKDLLQFIRKEIFDYVGAFKYSKEEKTESFKMRAVPLKRALTRFEEIEKATYISMEKRLDRFIGLEMEILYEGIDDELKVPVGRGWHQAPEIDGLTIITNLENQAPGQYLKCLITGRDGVDFIAEII
jgi:ribosomal protein S12 methylthiotransferase